MLVCLLAALAPLAQAQGPLVEHFGQPIELGPGGGQSCVTPEERAHRDRVVKAWFELGPGNLASQPLPSSLYTFYPTPCPTATSGRSTARSCAT
jgi:hypothetical protein